MTTESGVRLRVGTWNVHGSVAHTGELFLDGYIDSVIQEYDLDVVALQEIELLDSDVQRLALKEPYVIGAWDVGPSDVSRQGRAALGVCWKRGNATPIEEWILRKFDNPKWRRKFGTTMSTSYDKAFITGVLGVGSAKLGIMNLHGHPAWLFGQSPAALVQQWDAIAVCLDDRSFAEHYVILGDFNAEDRSMLTERVNRPLASIFRDWRTTYRGLALDDILVSPDCRVSEATVVETMSDHHLCFADIGIGLE